MGEYTVIKTIDLEAAVAEYIASEHGREEREFVFRRVDEPIWRSHIMEKKISDAISAGDDATPMYFKVKTHLGMKSTMDFFQAMHPGYAFEIVSGRNCTSGVAETCFSVTPKDARGRHKYELSIATKAPSGVLHVPAAWGGAKFARIKKTIFPVQPVGFLHEGTIGMSIATRNMVQGVRHVDCGNIVVKLQLSSTDVLPAVALYTVSVERGEAARKTFQGAHVRSGDRIVDDEGTMIFRCAKPGTIGPTTKFTYILE